MGIADEGDARGLALEIAALRAENQSLKETQQSRQRLEELNARLAAIVENSDDAIIGKSLDGIISTWNAGAERMFGYTAAEAVGKPIAMLVPKERQEEEPTILARLRRGERVDHFETVRVTREGEHIDVSLTISPIKDREGRIIGASKIARNITRQKVEEEELRVAKEAAETANQAKDRFLAVLSHELRTPLTPVLAGLTLLERTTELSEASQSEIATMRRNIEAEAKLIDELLDLTRISRGKLELHFEVVDAHTSLRRVLETCQETIESKELDVSLSLKAKRHQVWADPIRLQQILWNLLCNAVKFTPEGGQITLHTLNDAQNRLVIEISDTGVGMEPETLSRIFNAFDQGEQTVTRRFGGLGLGLTIAKTLAEKQRAELTGASPGKDHGSTFTFSMPPIMEPLIGVGVPLMRMGDPAKAPSILLVEDHPDTLRLMARILVSLGYRVKTASSVQAALDLADKERFDILVSDIGLPDGSGLDIMRKLKSAHLKGIAISGFGTPEDIRHSRESGFSTHLVKPVSLNTLESVLQHVVD